MRITFHGAARQVTGSAHLLEIGRHKILLDCGLFDSDRSTRDSPNRQLHLRPPRPRRGHRLARPQRPHRPAPLPGQGRLSRADLRHPGHRRHHQRHAPRQRPDPARGRPQRLAQVAPACRRRSSPCSSWPTSSGSSSSSSGSPTTSRPRSSTGVTLTYKDAGHILGSAIIQIDYVEDGKPRRFVFTGDLGRRNMGAPARPDADPGHRHPGLREHLRRQGAGPLRQADEAAPRDHRAGDPAPVAGGDPRLQPGPDPADGLLPPGAVRRPQGPADPGLRRQPPGPPPDRHPPRVPRGLHRPTPAG